ncbi:DUF748 domain-containing protein [Marinomonas sp. 5E14-1]|uniref:DUF748 domain-containing protein n=1 Tax=Marinomonas sp. 5E14-1 TaxID=3153922 RepID=UPI003265D5A0
MTRRHFRNFIFFPFSVLVIIVILIWIATPFIAKHYLTTFFQEQGEEASVDTISVDFFPPKIDIKNLVVTKQQQETLSLKHATFEVRIWPLLARTVRISEASIDGFQVTLAQQEKDWIVAGINTSQYFAEEAEEKEPAVKETPSENSAPWSINLPTFSFTDSQLYLSRQLNPKTPAQLDSFTLKKLTVKDLSGQGKSWNGEISLSALVNQARFSVSSLFDYSPEETSLDVKIEDTLLPIDSFQNFIPEPYNKTIGKLSLDGQLQLEQTQVNNEPFIEIKQLVLNSVIEDLDLSLNNGERVQTKSTALSISQSTIQFSSAEKLKATANITLKSQNTSFNQEDIIASYESFDFENALSVEMNDGLLTAQNNQLSINIQGLKGSFEEDKKVSIETVSLTAEQINADIDSQQAPSIIGTNLQFESTSFDSFLTDDKRIASFDKTGFNGLSFTQKGEVFDVALDLFGVDNLTFSEALTASGESQKALPALTYVGKIQVQNIKADSKGVSIDSIISDTVKVNTIISSNKALANLVFQEEQDSETASNTIPQASLQGSGSPKASDAQHAIENTPNAEQEPAFKAPYYVALKSFDITGESAVHVQDQSIKPALQRTLNIDTLSLRDLNTQDKEQATVLSLKARNGKYSTLDSNITIWPLADALTMQSTLVVKEAELPPYSSYIANALGYQIDSGQLNLDLKLDADNGVLDGNSHVLLRQFNLGGRQESNSVIKAGAVPLNIAVGILKDSDDNIDLDIPLSGNVNNPEFGWKSFLVQPVRAALYKVSSNYLMQTFIPYANVITIAQFAGEQLLKVRVEPLIFTAEEIQLNSSQDTFLEQLVALMKDKQESQLKACGVTSYLDLGFEKPPAELNDKMKALALNLAQERADNLKGFLVEKGISSSRILICSPEVDLSKSSQPRVELNF